MDFDSRNTTDKRKRVTLFSKREKKHELVNILKSTFNKLHLESILELHGILGQYFNANNVSLSVIPVQNALVQSWYIRAINLFDIINTVDWCDSVRNDIRFFVCVCFACWRMLMYNLLPYLKHWYIINNWWQSVWNVNISFSCYLIEHKYSAMISIEGGYLNRMNSFTSPLLCRHCMANLAKPVRL